MNEDEYLVRKWIMNFEEMAVQQVGMIFRSRFLLKKSITGIAKLLIQVKEENQVMRRIEKKTDRRV